MDKILDNSTVTIKKAVVSIEVLRVENKQMTLSLFRQIPHRLFWEVHDIIEFYGGDEEGICFTRLGTPWGIVRYTWKNSPSWADRYLLWEDSGSLYRTPLPPGIKSIHVRTPRNFVSNHPIFSREDWYSLEKELRTLEDLEQLFIAL